MAKFVRLALLIALLILCLLGLNYSAQAQGVRFSPTAAQTTSTVAGQTVITPLPGASITVCAYPAVGQSSITPCSNTITTYTDQTLTSTCASNAQIVLDGTSSCVAAADAQGNFGWWAPLGQASYSVCSGGGCGTYWTDGFVGVLLTLKKLNSIRFADQFPGGDPGAKIAAAIADLPTTGGTVDATGLEGAQTFAAGVSFPSDRPVMIRLGHSTISGPCPLFNGANSSDGSALIGVATGDWSLAGSHYGTKLVCTSGTDAIKFGAGSPRVSGIRVENLAINCNSVAARGLTIDTVQNSVFRNLETANCTSVSYSNKVSNVGADTNTQFNHYEKLTSAGSPICLQADNNAGLTSDWTHNTVSQFLCNYTGTAGIVLNGADNNWFFATRAARVSGAGPGVLLVAPAGANVGAFNNYFYGLIGGVTGVTALQAQTGTFGNTLYGYDFVNGEAAPSLLGTAELIMEGSVRCGPSGCAGASGTHPTPWIFAQGNAGNPPTSDPAPLVEGCALAWNWSNGGGEGDLACNLGGGNATSGILKLWKWDGAAKTARAVFPNSDIGTVVGTPNSNTVGRASCWKTATTLGFCSTVTDASGNCTCN